MKIRNKRAGKGKRQKRRTHPGAPPGHFSLPVDSPNAKITAVAYDQKRLVELQDCELGELAAMVEQYPVVWVNIDGLGDRSVLEEAARLFHIHPALEYA